MPDALTIYDVDPLPVDYPRCQKCGGPLSFEPCGKCKGTGEIDGRECNECDGDGGFWVCNNP